MMSFANTSRAATATPYYRGTYPPQNVVAKPAGGHNIADDYERWYTETNNNRMALSLQSGLDDQVEWALDRIMRLCHNDYVLKGIPGVLDSLFIIPEWYVSEGHRKYNNENALFATPRHVALQRRFAIQSLFILRNAALNEHDCHELVYHTHSIPLIIQALQNLDPVKDHNTEFLVHCLEFTYSILSHYQPEGLTVVASQIYASLQRIAAESSNRPSIIAALRVLTLLLGTPQNAHFLSPESPALTAAIRYLPLFMDKALVDASLNYLYVHLSQHVMSKLFLLHPDMPSVLRILFSLLISEQVETSVTLDITGDVKSTPSMSLVTTEVHDLTQAEFDMLLPMTEPQRCFEWMKLMFVSKPDGELTQVDFWTLYKDVFQPHQERYPCLPASEVIKNVNLIFPEAQAMVLKEPVQKFIVRGVDRRINTLAAERLKCQWDKGQCPEPVFPSMTELFDHVLEHIKALEAVESPCPWSTCPREAMPKANLRAHVITHLSRKHLPERHPSQSNTITLSVGAPAAYPTASPLQRSPPPPRSTAITYTTPVADPPTTSLTALLCIRLLFNVAFTSTEDAPRNDEDHFGFPGVEEEPEETDQPTTTDTSKAEEREGARRGRKAFVGVRSLMERVQIRDEALMTWITEMLDSSLSGNLLD